MDPGVGPITGIDLGTTFSSIAFLNAFGRAEIVPTPEGERSIPSVVLFEAGGDAVVGQAAKERSVECPERIVEFVKREMGDPDWVFPVDGKELRPQTISALILRRLIDMGEAKIGQRPQAAVITCPAYFGDLERQATADAGTLAGIEVQAVFNEPTAAALAFGLHHTSKGDRARALVYDLGGGTFDVTVLELKGRRVEVLATAGEHRLGGKDWDDELLNFAAEEFLGVYGQDPRDDLTAIQDLRNRCEAVKVALSNKRKARLFCRAFGKTHKLELTRQRFEELTRPLLLQTRTYVEQVLEQAKLSWRDLDVILPVGGSSHMPQVRQLLTEIGGREPDDLLDPDMAVAQGAVYYSALLRSEEGFTIEVKRARQPTGRVAKEDSEELPMLPPATIEDAPEELLFLPGEVASEEVLALPMLPPSGEEEELPALPPADTFAFADLIELEDPLPPPTPTGPVPGAPPPLPKPRQRAVRNVNAKGLGVLIHKGGEPRVRLMVAKNSQLPVTYRSRFYTINDNQTGVKVVILEGDEEDPSRCARIGECVISGLPPRAKGQPIEIGYSYDEDGQIKVWARHVETGETAQVELRREGSLDRREMAQAAQYVDAIVLS